MGKQISQLSNRWSSTSPPKYTAEDSGGSSDAEQDKFFAVVLGSAGADAHIREALEKSPSLEWDCVGYEPRTSRYRLNAASVALLEKVLMALYNNDIIDESGFMAWKNDTEDDSDAREMGMYQIEDFFTFLEQAESDDEESDDEDEDDE